MKLLDGILYEINFFQDFSDLLAKGTPVLTIDDEIIEDHSDNAEQNRITMEERQPNLALFKQADKVLEKQRKQERKWKMKLKEDGRTKKMRMRDSMRFLNSFTD